MMEALRLLRELHDRVAGETWVVRAMQRAVLTGIKMSIQQLEKEIAANGQTE